MSLILLRLDLSRVRKAILGFFLICLIWQADTFAQSAQELYRVGILSTGSASAPSPLVKQFTDELRALGYITGENIVFEYRGSEGKNERFGQLVRELIAQKVDVIFSPPAPATRAAREVTRTVPIVFTIAADPVALGLVNSIAKPGGNLTGVTEESPELPAKRVALLREILPQARKIGILWDTDAFGERAGREIASKTEQAAQAAGIEAEVIGVRGPADLGNAFESLARARVDALLVEPSPMFSGQAKRLAELAANNKIPAIYPWPQFVQAGGLMSMGADLAENFRRAAGYVDKILKGAKPGDLPIEQPTKFELVINLTTAKALSLTVPKELLLRADRVIE